ncbi:hypothetical protein SAMN05660479_02230 [Microbulbifer thermotolerans]|nr:hypothetical protein SAMN05660479_02230 [Microbulbifer thermotolerans]
MARFLSGRQVRAVWCEYWDSKKQDSKAERLLLSTNISLTAEEVIDSYSRVSRNSVRTTLYMATHSAIWRHIARSGVTQ